MRYLDTIFTWILILLMYLDQQEMRVGVLTDGFVASFMIVQDAYIAKVEELAKLKQKQDEDKAAVRLHCFRSVITICIVWFCCCTSYVLC